MTDILSVIVRGLRFTAFLLCVASMASLSSAVGVEQVQFATG